MADAVNNVTIKVKADVSGVEAGLRPAVDAANRFGQAIAQSAGRAADAARVVDSAQRNIIASIQRTTLAMQAGGRSAASYYESFGAEPPAAQPRQLGQAREQAAGIALATDFAQQAAAIGKVRAEMLELQAAQLGVAAQTTLLIDQLRAQGQAFLDGGMSAQAMNTALSTVPAQLDAIVASLEDGKDPLSAFLQQGAQLLDILGSVGLSGRALGSAALRLANPITAAVAVVTGLGIAYKHGHDEATAYSRALIMTGNAAGTTAGQMADMAARMEEVNGSRAQSAKALTTLASTGAIAGADLEKFGTVAVDAQRVLGQSVEDTARQFAALGKAPLGALQSIGDKYGFVTTETYRAVKAAQEQGRMTDAASIAQNAYADGLSRQKEKVLETLSAWERAWINLKEAPGKAWDAIIGFAGGRQLGPEEQIKALETRAAALEERIGRLKTAGKIRAGEKYDPTTDRDVQGAESSKSSIERDIERIRNEKEAKAKAARDEATANEREAVLREWNKTQVIRKPRREQRDEALEAAQARGTKLGISQAEIDKQKLDIQRQYNDVYVAGIDAGIAALRRRGAMEDELSQRALARINAERAAGEITEDEALRKIANQKLAEIGRQRQHLQEQLSLTRQKPASEREQQDLQGQIAVLDARRISREIELEDELAAAKRTRAQASMELHGKGIEAANAELNGISAQVEAQRLANEEIGLSKTELAKLHFARMNDVAAAKEQTAAMLDTLEGGAQQAETYRLQAAELRKLAAARREGGEKQDALETSKKALDELNQFLEPSRAKALGDALREAFGGAGESMAKMVEAMEGFAKGQEEIDKQRATAKAKRGTEGFDELKYQKVSAELNERETKNRLAGYRAMTSAAAGFFGEQSRGYKALQAASQVFHAAELAMTLAELVPKGISPVLNHGQGEPYSAPVRMAAMAAIVAGLGVAIGAIGGSDRNLSADRQKAQGMGTVLGSDAKSESISRSLDAIEDATLQGLGISNGMLTSLRNIEAGIGRFASLLVRTTGVTGDFGSELNRRAFDSKSLGLGGAVGGGVLGAMGGTYVGMGTSYIGAMLGGPVGLALGAALGALIGKTFIGKALGSVFGGKQSVEDTGITFDPTSFTSIFGGGLNAMQYADIKKDGGWFGKDKYSTRTEGLGEESNRQIASVLMSLYDTVLEAGTMLDIGADGFAAQLSSFVVDIGKISLKGLSNDEIEKELSAVFSKVGDDLARFGVAGLEQFQKVGEGYLETLTRVATNYQAVAVVTDSLGMTFGSLGLASVGARERLIDLVGGLDEFTSSADQFLSDFYTDKERADSLRARLAPTLDQFGIKAGAGDSLQQFRSVVTGLDLTTEAGARAYATLMQIAPAFKQIADVDAKIFEERADLQKELDQLTLSETELLARQRAALDESNRTLFDQIQAVKAKTAADEAATAAIERAKSDAAALMGGVDSAFSVLQRVVERQKQALQDEIGVRTASIQKIEALSQSLRSTLDGMTVAGREAEDRQVAQAQIQAALAIAKASGKLPSAEDLGPALSVVSRDSAALFATQQDYLRDFYATRNGIEELSGLTDKALTVEERSLKQLEDQVKQYDLMLEREQAQIEVLKGISVTGLSIEQALLALRVAMLAAGSNPVISATSAINDAYKSALGRAPDQAGLDFWKEQAAGGLGTGAIVDTIKNSPEAKIRELYRDVFGRAPDGGGLQFWVGQMNGGMSLAAIRDAMLGSDEKIGLRGLAVGANYIPVDMPAMVHQGERIIPAADNRELMRRLASPEQNNQVLAEAVERLTREVEGLRAETRAVATHTEKSGRLLGRVIREDALVTKQETT